MFRFFRKVRQRLVVNKNVRRYLLYALGEILLVVIGIVIALQIDNWNEWRQEREDEQIVLRQLRDDYQANREQLEQKMQIRDALISAASSILEEMDHPEQTIRDSLIGHLTVLLIDPTFDPIENDLSSNGDLRLITNQRLKRMLSNWTSDIVAVRELEQNWSTIVFQQLQPVLRDLGITRDLSNYFVNNLKIDWTLDGIAQLKPRDLGSSKQGATVEEIANSKELEGLVSAAITYNATANLESHTLHRRIEEILDLLEGEIK
jgi:hypothetical protein